jgi:uncharacterized protein involved in outer membrane biogenesis
MTIWPKTRLSRALWAFALVVLVYSATAYFGVPMTLRYLARNEAAVALQRPVTLGEISFNPYTLRLSIAGLSISGSDGHGHFIEIDQAELRLSWTSLFRRALILNELKFKRPSIHVARVGSRRFDVSDLLDSFSQNRSSRSTGFSFAISNVEVDDGLILFDDRVLKKVHRLEDIWLAIPFIANLPTDTDKYVQPLLKMRADGSRFSLTGRTKPFRGNLDSTVEINVQKLDITPLAEYAADMLPFKLRKAELSTGLQVHFIEMPVQPELQIAGTMTLDNVVANDVHDSPLASLRQLRAVIAQFEPLVATLRFSSIAIDSLSSHLVINQDGTTNVALLFGGNRVKPPTSPHSQKPGSLLTQPTQNPTRSPISAPTPPLLNPMEVAPSHAAAGISATPSPSGKNIAVAAGSQFSLAADSIEVNKSTLDVVDRSGPAPVELQLLGLNLGVRNFVTAGQTTAPYTFSASLKSGGELRADGNLDLASSRATGKLAFASIDLPPFQQLVARFLAANIVSGKFSGQALLRASFGEHFNLHGEPAQISVDGVELRSQTQPQGIVGWKHLTGKIDQFDLASHQFVVRELLGNGLHLTALRDPKGNVNLASLISTRPAGNQTGQRAAASAPWRYRIESLTLKDADAEIDDLVEQQPVSMRIAPLNLQLHGLTSDLAKPFTVQLDGNLGRRGTFKIAGETAINPFQGRLHIAADHIGLAALEPLIDRALATNRLNARITNGVLAVNGDAQSHYRDGNFDAAYHGDVALRGVRISDRLTGVSLLRWYELNLRGVSFRSAPPTPGIQIGAIELSDFYARLILNSDGRLNVLDILPNPAHPAVSITQPGTGRSAERPAPATPADINVASIRLNNGEVNYLDNFINPHYSALLTQLEGNVGAFGTNGKKPADILLAGKLDRTSLVSISGSINPLAPMASLDLQANAAHVQLRPLSPYSARYTGYPITGGTLSANVHYVLALRRLTATNHLLLDQLTVGERVENSSARNLPLRLAIAVLKDSQGRINVSIPISGSLTDPQFDLGRLMWAGLVNVILKAAASPFTALSSALGSEQQDLSYVGFAPGYSTLTEGARNRLAKLIAVLEERSALKLQITGRVDPRLDTQGLREASLDNQIKRRKAETEHLNPTPADLEEMEVTPDEYDRYLWRVYKAADFAKSRDFVGMVKRLPPDEMKKLLLANIKITDADLQHLAEARAAAVFQVLSAKIDRSRLLVTPPKLNSEGISKGLTTRVDFALQ